MHKIEGNELWPKVVECYFKKLFLDNLFHKAHLFNSRWKLFLLFFNILRRKKKFVEDIDHDNTKYIPLMPGT